MMKLSRHTLASAAFAFFLSIVVIVVANYYESPGLLAFQIIFIAGPTLAPLLILPKTGAFGAISWIVIASLMIAGWSYVVYIDTRPYEGGGATFALLFGWFTCFVASAVAALIRILHVQFAARG